MIALIVGSHNSQHMVGNHQRNGTKGGLVLIIPHCNICSSDGRGSQTDSGLQDSAIHNPPEILALEPKLHLVNPDVVIGRIKNGDCYFDIVGGSRRYVVDRFLKRSLSARGLSLKKKLKED